MNESAFQRDRAYGEVSLKPASEHQDKKQATDYNLSGLHIAMRRRRIPVWKYGEISIRYKRYSGVSTEAEKILRGIAIAQLYIFEFTDAFVVMRVEDIKIALASHMGKIVANPDGLTEALYLPIEAIPHLLIPFKSRPSEPSP